MRRFTRDFRRAVTRFRNVPHRKTFSLYARALALHAFEPSPARQHERPERLVVSLSTIPSRVGHLRPVLNSLIDQSEPADRIVLALPRHSLREGKPYPDSGDLKLPKPVEILHCEDLGPATKLLPVLLDEPNAAIIVVDDDVVYPPRFVETLLTAHRVMPGTALGYRGVRLDRAQRFADLEHLFATSVRDAVLVDVLFGTWGYLVPPGALDDSVHNLAHSPEELRWVDDVWISGHLARRGIPRAIVRATEIPIETLNALRRSLTRGPNRSGLNDNLAIEAFLDDW
jgi:hypothetical protein